MAHHKVELEPWTVPGYVRTKKQDSTLVETAGFPTSELDVETLEAVCREFVRNVFKKAKKIPPQVLRLDKE
jgi:hypothetical protein